MGVSWFSVEVRVDSILIKNDCRVQEGDSLQGKVTTAIYRYSYKTGCRSH